MKAERLVILFLLSWLAFAQSGKSTKKQVTISGDGQWTDTGVSLHAGDTVTIEATGTLTYEAGKESGPEGMQRGFMDLLKVLPSNEAGRGALLGRIGSSAAARSFLAGAHREMKVPIDGNLFLSVNQGTSDQPSGSFAVTVTRTAGVAPKLDPNVRLPRFTQAQLDSLPLRVNDALGNAGDRVNFIIVGSQDRMESALKAAGWQTVDKTPKDAVLRGLIASLSKEGYTTLPMSELMLFGRNQDYGWAQADPIRVIQSRHHFRLWKAPFTADGQTVWVGAGTHDIGLEKDQRNGKLTHKIDPKVDGERDYIAESLKQSGMVAKEEYMTPANAITTARTATGGTFESDGRTLIVYLLPDSGNSSGGFADLFCSVLKQNNPDTGDWGSCAQYVGDPGKEDLTLAALPTTYRVLIVPGILSSCVSDTPAFQEGQQALRDKYGMTVELLQVPNDSSEDNAKMIGQYLREHLGGTDKRKYIVVGYSKGGPDVQTVLATDKNVVDAMAAFVTVAGASGGSPIADVLPSQANRWLQMAQVGNCKGDLAAGFKSLQKSVRQAFLATYPDPFVPTYSVAASSNKTNTSKALLESWQLLSAFGALQDGQLMKDDAVVPGAKYLGILKGDHFAVALPFDKSPDSVIRNQMNQTRFPRAALLESLVRYVVADLPSAP